MLRGLRKSQGVLEYTLLLGAIIAVIVAVLLGSGERSIKGRVEEAYLKAGDAIEGVSESMTQGIFGMGAEE
ncbi:MAG: hypothetical protein JSW17_03455 [Candidatus Omnitrophota bacterium]|nr:MAG: hypothetical protein JSW17_03455 [Candidatus Omnitrophota bacterium]